MWDPSAKLFLLILLKLYCSRRFHRHSTWIRGEICFIGRFHSRGWASAQIFFVCWAKEGVYPRLFSAVLPGRQNKAPAQCIREDTEVVIMALHLVFPALRPMAPLSDDLCFFSLPASSHPTSSWVCIFHPEEAVSFSQPYLGEWVGSV